MKVQVVTDISADHGPELATFALRGKKARWNLFAPENQKGSGSYRIYDGDVRRFYTVVPEQKTVFLVDASTLEADAGAPKSYTFTPNPLEAKGAVRGYPCDRMRTHDDDLEYNVCLAKGLPTLPYQLFGQGISQVTPFGKTLEDKGLLPLAVTAHKRGAGTGVGQVTGSLVVLEMARGAVPDSAFTWPDYYARVPGVTLDMHPALR
jgi:hypothetical protein